MRGTRAACALIDLLLIVVWLARNVEAQSGRVGIGIHAAYNVSDLNEPAAGGHVIIALPAGLSIYPAIQSYVVASGSLWRVSTLLRWAPKAAPLQPYMGVSAYWTRSSAGACKCNGHGRPWRGGNRILDPEAPALRGSPAP